MPVYHFEFESYNLSHCRILSLMKNITKLKSLHQNRPNPYELGSQKNSLNSKSTSLKRARKQKQPCLPKGQKIFKNLNNEYYPKEPKFSRPQKMQKNIIKYLKKRQFGLTVPYISEAVKNTSQQKMTYKNLKSKSKSRSKSKFVKRSMKTQFQKQKIKKDSTKKLNPEVNKITDLNIGAKQKKKYFKSSQNNSQKHKSLIAAINNSKSAKKSIKNLYDQRLNKNIKTSLEKVTKSSCITRNASENNSKEKQYRNTQKQLNQKFKKKTLLKGGLQKKTKITQVYSSMKISPRNSFKFVQTKSNQFLILDQYNYVNPQKEAIKNQKQPKNAKIEIKKIKSEKNIYERLKEYVDSKNESFTQSKQNKQSKNSFKKDKQFSFLQFRPSNKAVKSNLNEISIERLLQTTQDEINFNFECEEFSREKMTVKEQNFSVKVKQESFSSFQKLQQLSLYESRLFNERSYSNSSQLFKIAQENKVNFKEINIDRKSLSFVERIQILDQMSMLSSQLLLKTQTYHLAAAYYDIYLSLVSNETNFIEQSQCGKRIRQLKLIALGCLLVAIKMDERQYEFDILNAILSLENTFHRKEIIRSEFQILKKLRLKLKMQTLSFYLDYLSSKWDQFILSKTNFSYNADKLLLRSVDGRSYENYRKVVSILNATLLDAGIFDYQLIDIVISVFYAVFYEIIAQESKQTVLEEIKFTRENFQNSSTIDEKSTIKIYATRDTLDQLSRSDLKQNSPQNQSIISMKTTNQEKVKSNNKRKIIKKRQAQSTFQCFKNSFAEFSLKTGKKHINQLESSIKYVEGFLELKMDFQMDQRVYEEARNYEEFIRYHSHLPFSKIFVSQKYFQQNIFESNTQNFNSQKHSNMTEPQEFDKKSLLIYYQDDKIFQNNNCQKINNNLDQLLFQKVQKVFENKQNSVFSS